MEILPCQIDAYQQKADCEVLSCEPQKNHYQVILAKSILYPEGGGQPPDQGWLGEARVTDVQKHEPGLVKCTVDREVPTGTIQARVDWERRFDFMQQHSGQHLLTALANERLNAPTVGFHLGLEHATIELKTDHFTKEHQEQLLTWANQAIREARPIRWEVVTPEQYKQKPIRSRGLPDGHQGDIRLIEIEGIDLNTCGGTHVSSTSELQMITFVGMEKIRGNFRLSYLAGERARKRFQQQFQRERQLSELLSNGPEQHLELVQKLQTSLGQAKKVQSSLHQELASLLGQSLAQSAGSWGESLCVMHREEQDFRFLESIANVCLQHKPEALVVLTASSQPKGPGVFFCAGNPQQVKKAGDIIAQVMDGRGGGRPGRYQGKINHIEKREDACQALAKHFAQ